MLLKILADAMGLGKTIMTIALLLTHSERGGSSSSQSGIQPSSEGDESDIPDQLANPLNKATKISGFDKFKQKKMLVNGGNLIICPMTLLGQWKVLVLPFYAYFFFLFYFILHIALLLILLL